MAKELLRKTQLMKCNYCLVPCRDRTSLREHNRLSHGAMIEDEEPLEWAVISATLVLAVLFLGVLGVTLWVVSLHGMAVRMMECKNNPGLLYAVPCSSPDDCLAKCVTKLRSGGG